jgi:hypothetical protein
MYETSQHVKEIITAFSFLNQPANYTNLKKGVSLFHTCDEKWINYMPKNYGHEKKRTEYHRENNG